jgi:5-formyltetrahydrofolate cyclo-ligase
MATLEAGGDRAILRARMAASRGELDARQRVAAAAGVVRSLETLPEFMTDLRVAGYWAVRGELPLNLAVASLHRRAQKYFLPILDDMRQLRFAEYSTGTTVRSNRFGIPEPEVAPDRRMNAQEMDLVLVGTGGGFYDTTFAFLRKAKRPGRPLLVGVGFTFQQVDAIRTRPWDVPLDYVATERELIACADAVPDADDR